MFKKGQTVYTVSNHAISEWKFVRVSSSEAQSSVAVRYTLQHPAQPRHYIDEKSYHVFGTRSAAVLARIAQLQKTVKSLLTSAENHKATIRKLQREVRKLK